MKTVAAVFLALLLAGSVFATEWGDAEKTDPLTGGKVPAQEIISSGSYIYEWPSKYDLVFWPLTDEAWICLNPKNGYAAFNDDFEKLADDEKKGLADWLAKNYKPEQAPTSHKEKLAWLEKVYGQRKMNEEFWCRFYRLMAYVHREDAQISAAYVKQAVSLLEKKRTLNLEGEDKLEVLYLLGEYHRRLGDSKKAQEYFGQVKAVKYKDKDGREQTAHPYFVSLCEDRQKLMTQ